MIGNHRPTKTTTTSSSSLLAFLLIPRIANVESFHHRPRGSDVSAAFTTSVRRRVNSMYSMSFSSSSSSSPLQAATIDASSDIYHHGPSFYVGGCLATNDDDCLLFERSGGGGGITAPDIVGAEGGGGTVVVASASAPPPPSVARREASKTTTMMTATTTTFLLAAVAAALIAIAVGAPSFSSSSPLGGAVAWMPSSILRRLTCLSSWYLMRLEESPLMTKCVTGGMIALFGDYGAQWFEYSSSSSSSSSRRHRTGEVERPTGKNNDGRRRPLSIHGTYDARRGMARFLECLLVSSPLMHVGYDIFERVMPVVSGAGMYRSLAALSHVIADSLLLDGIFVCTGIVATGLLEGRSFRRQVLPNLRNVYLPTLRASVVTSSALMPLQFLSFRFLPIQLRVLSVNAVDLIWTAVVSFVSHGGGGGGGEGGGVVDH
ncbi:hypothetical protein ACHAXA_007739 [Cyclostephanos tholiformis]|uniref:Protein Mpv17 n=1 Tax=Cyclostephanos tholiformis TaxID=382380 RepID=A0ABD3RYD4_9STRA